MTAEAPQSSISQAQEAVAPLPLYAKIGRLIGDANEYASLQTQDVLTQEPSAVVQPENTTIPYESADNSTVLDPEQAAGSVTEFIKDMYYRAGAEYMLLTQGGFGPNPPKQNEIAKQHRERTALGIGILVCAKIGLDVVRAGYGMHVSYQSDVLNDIVSNVTDKSVQGQKKGFKVETGAVVDAVLDYTPQSLDATTNALISTHAKSNRAKAAKPKTSSATAAQSRFRLKVPRIAV